LQLCHRLHHSRSSDGDSPSLVPVPNGLSRQSGFGKMVREEFGLGFDDLRELGLQHLGDAGVQLLAAGFEERAVGGVLNEGVLEAVGDLGRAAAAVDQLGCDQLVEGGLEVRLRAVGDGGEERMGELAAERGSLSSRART